MSAALKIPTGGGAVTLAEPFAPGAAPADRLPLELRRKKSGEVRTYLNAKARAELAEHDGRLSIEGRGAKHATAINGRLERDVPLFLHAGLVERVTPQQAQQKIITGEARVEVLRTEQEAATVRQRDLWRRTLESLGASIPPPNTLHMREANAVVYEADRYHCAAREVAPWVDQNSVAGEVHCDHCGTVEKRPLDSFERQCAHEAAFICAHVRCTIAPEALHAASADDADVVIDHERGDGTRVWIERGHWKRAVVTALGKLFDAFRSYGRSYFLLCNSRLLDVPAVDLDALAESLRAVGARVWIDPAARVCQRAEEG